jgi:ankyrin repeat protein
MVLFLVHSVVLALAAQHIAVAVENNDFETVEALLKKNKQLVHALDKYGNSLLHRAVIKRNTKLVEILIKYGANVNVTRKDTGSSPLHGAATYSTPEIVSLLLKNGANVNVKTKIGDTPLNFALRNGRKEIANILIDNGGKLNTEIHSNISILRAALSSGITRIVKTVIDKNVSFTSKAVDGNTLLHYAAIGGLIEYNKLFISKGLKADDKNIYGQTPLHFAAGEGHLNLIELFLNKGAYINIKTIDGRTPVHYARERGKKEVENYLIRKGGYSGKIEFPELKGKYLGQKRPGLQPEIFAPGIISTNEYGEHSYPAFSPDYHEIYWSAHSRGKQRIYFMKMSDGKWSAPKVAPFSGVYDDGNPSFSRDGTKLYYDSTRPLEKDQKPADRNIWFLQKKGQVWSEPIPLDPIVNTNEHERFASVTKDGTLYYKITTDLYRARRMKGRYQAPEKLDQINTEAFEIGPYIAPDESYLIFESSRPGGFGGIDLYICYRKSDDTWSKAINLGVPVNTKGHERFPAVSPDGKYFFYLGERGDIYWIDARVITKTKSNLKNQ